MSEFLSHVANSPSARQFGIKKRGLTMRAAQIIDENSPLVSPTIGPFPHFLVHLAAFGPIVRVRRDWKIIFYSFTLLRSRDEGTIRPSDSLALLLWALANCGLFFIVHFLRATPLRSFQIHKEYLSLVDLAAPSIQDSKTMGLTRFIFFMWILDPNSVNAFAMGSRKGSLHPR